MVCCALPASHGPLQGCPASSGGLTPGGGGLSPATWMGGAADDTELDFGDAALPAACVAAARLPV